MKPNGMRFVIGNHGPELKVTKPSKVEDLIWEAVEEAQLNGWTAKMFRYEVMDAWEESLKRQIESDMKEFER